MTKYRAKPITIDGIRFASQAEGNHYLLLKARLAAGEITNLELQPRFPVHINGVKVCEYRADFAYFEGEHRRVVDVKGYKTAIYRLKKKLVEAAHPAVRVVEVSK